MNAQEPSHDSVHSNDEFDRNFPRGGSFAIDAYGVSIGIRTDDSSILGRLPAHLPFGWAPRKTNRIDRHYSFQSAKRMGAGNKTIHILRQRSTLLAESEVLDDVLHVFESDLELYVVANAPRHVFVHAGVVGWHGGAILIPGRSFSGKSSLVAALCHFGAIYYSDEFAILDVEGRVHPYRRPLHLRQAVPHIPAAQSELPAESETVDPLPLRLMLLTQFQRAAQWNPQPLSRGQAILHLIANTMGTQTQPEAVLAVLTQTLRSACAIQSPRGEACKVAHPILSFALSHAASAVNRIS